MREDEKMNSGTDVGFRENTQENAAENAAHSEKEEFVPAESAAEDESYKNDRFYEFAKGKGIMNLPNKLTISRMVMIPVFALFFYLQFTAHFFIALIVFAAASLTDLFDGKIARKYHLVTNLGKFLDPIADKVLVSTAFILTLTTPWIYALFTGEWAVIVAGCGVALILAREIIISGFRMVAADAGVVIAADMFGKYKTVFQDACIVMLLISAGVTELYAAGGSSALLDAACVLNYIGLILFALAIILTVLSGVNYIVRNISLLKK